MSEERETISVKEAAELAGVSVRTIRRYLSEGLLTPEVVRGRSGDTYRLRREEVLKVKGSKREFVEQSRTSPVGKLADELHALRGVIEGQSSLIEEQRRVIDELRHEQRDTRAQIHQLHEQLLALPARTEETIERKWWELWKRKKPHG